MDRLAELRKTSLKERLGKGSAYMRKVRSSGHRCKGGWTGLCPCGSQATPFCKAKFRWIRLLREFHDGNWPYGLTGQEEFAIIEAMTLSQFEASGLTALVKVPGAEQPIRITPDRIPLPEGEKEQGKYWMRSGWWMILELALTVPGEDRDSALETVQNIQKVMV